MTVETAYRIAIVLATVLIGAFNLAAGVFVFAVLTWQLRTGDIPAAATPAT